MKLRAEQLDRLRRLGIDPEKTTVDECIPVILRLDQQIKKLGADAASFGTSAKPNRGEPNRGTPHP
jgi:hypothetical protein